MLTSVGRAALSAAVLRSAGRSTLSCRSIATRGHATAAATERDPNVVRSPYPDVLIPDLPFFEYAWRHLDHYPDRVAMECGLTGRRYTYAEARSASRKFATALVRAGLGLGDMICLYLPNCPEFPLIVLGANEAGVSICPINPAFNVDEVSKQLRDSRPRAAATTPALHPTLTRAFREAGLPPPRLVVTVPAAASSAQTDAGATPPGAADFLQLVQQPPADADLAGLRASPDDLFLMPYSSGTTGLPKGVMLSNRNLVANLQQAAEPQIQLSDVDSHGVCNPGEVVPIVLPMFHLYALSLIMLQKFAIGATIISMPKFEPPVFLDVLVKYKATLLYVVPPVLLFLTQHPMVKRQHLESINYVISSAAPLGQNDIDRFLEKTTSKTKVVQAYGMTETSPCVFLPSRSAAKGTTVGKPVPNTLLKVVDIETSAAVGANQMGELLVKGPQVMTGYYNNPKATADTFIDGWLRTGDIGYYDSDADFYIADRIKEFIKVKGFQVSPAELEEVLRSHPAIEEAAVIGVPHERSGEAPKAFVVVKKDKQNELTKDNVTKFVDAKVAEYKRLAGGVEFIDAIPKNPSGKILRRVLRQKFQ